MFYNITRDSGIPLIGTLFMGVIDRGSNLLQIRPTTLCNLNCTFCSTGISNKELRPNHFSVELDYLVDIVKEIASYKDTEIIAFIESVGEPLTYPRIAELIKEIKSIPQVERTVLVTNATLLAENLIKRLEGNLDQINISIHALDEDIAKSLSGSPDYNLKKIIESIKKIKNIEIWLTPVWIPNVNDKEIPKIIEFAKSISAKMGIQKYEIYKYSNKIKKAKKITYFKFYKQLEEWEKEYNYKLKIGPSMLKIKKTRELPLVFKKGEKVSAIIKCPSWMKNQMIAVSSNRAIAVNNCNLPIESKVRIKILQNKDNIYIAELLN